MCTYYINHTITLNCMCTYYHITHYDPSCKKPYQYGFSIVPLNIGNPAHVQKVMIFIKCIIGCLATYMWKVFWNPGKRDSMVKCILIWYEIFCYVALLKRGKSIPCFWTEVM